MVRIRALPFLLGVSMFSGIVRRQAQQRGLFINFKRKFRSP